MSYTLILGDYAYSSWSLRAWLLFEVFGIPRQTKFVSFGDDSIGWTALKPYAPARTVPTLQTPDGAIVSDSLAIAEELASREPEAAIWPSDPLARATARTLAAEMHSGFAALREACPMNLRCAYSDYTPSQAVRDNLDRIDVLWQHALDTFGGPWLCGSYSAADAFFAPVAARIATYDLAMSDRARVYVEQHLSDPAFRRWRAMGLVRGPDLPWYLKDCQETGWPGPKPLNAAPSDGPSVNSACPYSGDPVTHFLDLDSTQYGFCNAFCRDKTVADPEAWPKFQAIRV